MRRFLHHILSFGHSHGHSEAQEPEEGDRHASVSDLTTTTVGPSTHSPPLSASIVGFAIDLYRQLVVHTGAAGSNDGANACGKSAGTPGNVVFSPFAVAAALSMTLAGARCVTAKPAFTGPDEFHVDAHTVVRVNMMNQMQPFGIAHSDQLQATALEMPHLGGKTCMVIILPDQMDGLPTLEQNLTTRNLSDLLNKILVRPNVMLKLPKFVVQLSCKLREPLKAMGVRELFTTRANLSGIFEIGSPTLADVFHGAFLEVNEEGAESTAPSVEAVVGGGPGLGEITRLTVNRPFIFLIKPRHGNIIFIMGSVRRP